LEATMDANSLQGKADLLIGSQTQAESGPDGPVCPILAACVRGDCRYFVDRVCTHGPARASPRGKAASVLGKRKRKEGGMMRRCPLGLEPCTRHGCRYFAERNGPLDPEVCLWWAAHRPVEDRKGHRGDQAYGVGVEGGTE
jgi:hypothetical protein